MRPVGEAAAPRSASGPIQIHGGDAESGLPGRCARGELGGRDAGGEAEGAACEGGRIGSTSGGETERGHHSRAGERKGQKRFRKRLRPRGEGKRLQARGRP